MRLMGPKHQLHSARPSQLLLSNFTHPLEGLAQKLDGWREVGFTKGRGTCPFPTWTGSVVGRLGLRRQGQSGIRQPCGFSMVMRNRRHLKAQMETFEEGVFQREGGAGVVPGIPCGVELGVPAHLLPLDDGE